MSTELGTYKFYYTNGKMVRREFKNAGEASEFAWTEGDHLVRWCVDRDDYNYDFINGFWVAK